MTDRPQPKPGILDISPYKPGKAAVEGDFYPRGGIHSKITASWSRKRGR